MPYYFRDGAGCPWIACDESVVGELQERGFETTLADFDKHPRPYIELASPPPAIKEIRGWKPVAHVACIVAKAMAGQSDPEHTLAMLAALFQPPKVASAAKRTTVKSAAKRSAKTGRKP